MITTGPAPTVDPASLVGPIVQRAMGRRVRSIASLTGGSVARAFRVETEEGDLVIRLQHGVPDAFSADRAVGALIRGTAVPVPALHATGHQDGWAWAISDLAPGQRADLLPAPELAGVLPDLLRVLATIPAVDVEASLAGEVIDLPGGAPGSSWRQSLGQTFDEVPGTYWAGWRESLAERMDWELFGRLEAAMRPLLDHVPDARWLVHGDYGFSNVLVESGRMTAVLDWSGARIGDFVYDYAWLAFFLPPKLRPIVLDAITDPRGGPLDHLSERIRCYQLIMAMDCLRFYVRADDAPALAWARGRAMELLAAAETGDGS